MDSGGVRRKMAHKNCEHINAVKTVKVLKMLVRRRTTFFFQRYGNFILTPTEPCCARRTTIFSAARYTDPTVLPRLINHF